MKTDKKIKLRAKERKSKMLANLRIDYCLFVTASSYGFIFTFFILLFSSLTMESI